MQCLEPEASTCQIICRQKDHKSVTSPSSEIISETQPQNVQLWVESCHPFLKQVLKMGKSPPKPQAFHSIQLFILYNFPYPCPDYHLGMVKNMFVANTSFVSGPNIMLYLSATVLRKKCQWGARGKGHQKGESLKAIINFSPRLASHQVLVNTVICANNIF